MIKSKFSVLVLVLLLSVSCIGSIGCGGKHPGDVVAKPVLVGTDGYIFIVENLNIAREASLINDEQWETIDQYADQGDEITKNALEIWVDLTEVKAPEKVIEIGIELRKLIEISKKLLAFLPADKKPEANRLIAKDEEAIRELGTYVAEEQ